MQCKRVRCCARRWHLFVEGLELLGGTRYAVGLAAMGEGDVVDLSMEAGT